jgi:hypothetical protein
MIAKIGDSIEYAFRHLYSCARMILRNVTPDFNEILDRLT